MRGRGAHAGPPGSAGRAGAGIAALLVAALVSLAVAPAAVAGSTPGAEACDHVSPPSGGAPGGELIQNTVLQTVVKEDVARVVKLSGVDPGFTPSVPESKDPTVIHAALVPQLPVGSAFTVEVSDSLDSTTAAEEVSVESTCSEDAAFVGAPAEGESVDEALLDGKMLVAAGTVTVTTVDTTVETEHITRTVTIDITSLGPPAPPPSPEAAEPPASEPGEPPDFATALFDGKTLHIRLKCPKRFKPGCLGSATAITATRCHRHRGRRHCHGGAPITSAASAKQRAGRWEVVVLKVKPKDRRLVARMAEQPGKTLIVRQALHAKRFKHGRHQAVFHRYTVRSEAAG